MDTQIRLEITRREPFAEGTAFGAVGEYEKITGQVHFALDPDDPSNGTVTDLEHTPRVDGRVEFASDFSVLRPVDLDSGTGRLVYGVNNRGNKRLLQFLNDGVHSNDPSRPEHAGNGYLMREGYSILWSGWQGNLRPGDGRLTMDLPVASREDGRITGPTRTEFVAEEPGTTCIPLSANEYTQSYETDSLETGSATFTRREYESDRRIAIAPDEWEFAEVTGDGPVPSRTHCHYPPGFEPGWIYELVYTARDPPVMGLGFAGVRDLVAFFRHADVDREGTANPLREEGAGIDRAYAWGRSQSGRFLREFVYGGFNADTRGRAVFDGVFPHVSGAGRVALNQRFAQPGRFPRQHQEHHYPSDQFPFAYDVTTDPHTGERDGIRKRPGTDPLVVHTQTSSEYWDRRGSLVHTDPEGNDLGEQDGARLYLFASSQHHADPLLDGPESGPYRYPTNPLNTTPLLRALLDALDAWVSDGVEPPRSRVPTHADETAVTPAEIPELFPEIPGVDPPDEPNRLFVQEFGPEYDDGIVSNEPPSELTGKEYPVSVPRPDADGNDEPGIRTPEVDVPLATYTGWNFRPEGASGEALAGVTGSYFPFAATGEERKERGDPRPSVGERYGTRARYVRRVATVAQELVERRLLLPEDADRYVESAMAEDRVAPNGLGEDR